MIFRASLGLILLAVFALPLSGQQTARIADLTVKRGEIQRRLVGFGIVTGLDGTGDRSFGTSTSSTMTVRSVVNLLRRFNLEIPSEQLRLRNVAAVLVTAEISPFLRAGGRFEVQVGAVGDASSLRGGILWMTPLVIDPNQPPVATAQGPLLVSSDGSGRVSLRQGNAGRIADGGLLEVDLAAPVAPAQPGLGLRTPDLRMASRITQVINATYKDAAKVEDAGSIRLNPGTGGADSLSTWLASIDTLLVPVVEAAKIVIDGRDGTVVVGGEVKVGAATVSSKGLTLEVRGVPDAADSTTAKRDSSAVSFPNVVRAKAGATVQEIVAGLAALGAKPAEVAAIFDALRAAGAIRAQVVIR
ncbi:MAG: flagellar basal body P-ring protein FlgI [Gemmatimonadota bacterium]